MPKRYRRLTEAEIAETAKLYEDRGQRDQFVQEAPVKLNETVRQAELELQLKQAVQRGWLAYLLVPLAIGLALNEAVKTQSPRVRIFLAFSVATNVLIAVLVIYRGYFTALTRGS